MAESVGQVAKFKRLYGQVEEEKEDDVGKKGKGYGYDKHNLINEINLHKSLIFGVDVDSTKVSRLASVLGCSSANFPFTFIGILVGQNMHRKEDWKGVIYKVTIPLASWKANLLFSGGRLTLGKSVLGAIGTHTMSLFQAPKKVIQIIESLHSKFFWGAKDNERKIHWVN
ncbi:uncharacterized protein [Rutidosis leptorrhynchoides]|uniref:uncharacterized protein n=1 Tax=Rutidosis leptorrhynchoides TaxID=125765 RepID=UPI003A998699